MNRNNLFLTGILLLALLIVVSGCSNNTGQATLALKGADKTGNIQAPADNSGKSPEPVALGGDLYVDSNPAGASLYIDNTYIGLTPTTAKALSIGGHSVQITLNGYYTYTSKISIQQGKNYLNITLTQNTTGNQTASISVASNPAGANVYLDSVYKGTSPTTLLNVPVGYHTVLLTKTGYFNISEYRNYPAGFSYINWTLMPLNWTNTSDTTPPVVVATHDPQSPVAYQQITYTATATDPSGILDLNLYINDIWVNSSMCNPAGGGGNGTSRTFQCTVAGYPANTLIKFNATARDNSPNYNRGYSGNDIFTVGNNQTNTTNTTGILSVASVPLGADTYLDGIYKGLTPMTIQSVPIGLHDVRLIKTGYYIYATSINIVPGFNYVNATLVVNNTGNQTNNDTTPPSVTITSPANYATVSGTITIAATASDNIGVAGVQFKVDGIDVGPEDTTSPYSTLWNSSTTSNEAHSITAIARDTSGNTGLSNAVVVYVNNSLFQTGDFYVMTYPAGADITVDTTYYNVTPRLINGLSVGNHFVHLYKQGYYPYNTTKYLNQGYNFINITLVQMTGDLHVATSPPGADIYVDGTYYNVTPGFIAGLTVGNHFVHLYKQGYYPYNTTKYIDVGNNYINISLIPTNSS